MARTARNEIQDFWSAPRSFLDYAALHLGYILKNLLGGYPRAQIPPSAAPRLSAPFTKGDYALLNAWLPKTLISSATGSWLPVPSLLHWRTNRQWRPDSLGRALSAPLRQA